MVTRFFASNPPALCFKLLPTLTDLMRYLFGGRGGRDFGDTPLSKLNLRVVHQSSMCGLRVILENCKRVYLN